MSIFDETGQASSLTQDRSLRLFTDRYEIRRSFARRLNQDPPAGTVIFLYGLGGNGKSLLLRLFETQCCYRLSPAEWSEVWSYPEVDFVKAIAKAPSAARLPVARIDFGARPVGENRPQEALAALFMLKRQLAEHKLAFPRFDFAAITYLHRSGLEISKRLEELFPKKELDIAMQIAKVLLDLPVLRTGLNLLEVVNNNLGDAFSRRRLQWRVPAETAAEILSLAPEPDLADALPRYFAADLGEALGEARWPRVVLLFDTHEAFFGEGISEDPDSFLYAGQQGRDEWFRSLLGNLNLGAGIVPVVAGRVRPRWAHATKARIPERFVDCIAVGALSTADAIEYLTHAGIEDEALRTALAEYASAAPGEVHPFFLGLCADVALSARNRGRDLDPASFSQSDELAERERGLAARLLAWVTPEVERSIVALSACRSFDYAAFHALGERFGFPATRADFDKLVSFSFVSKLERSTGPGDPSGEQAFAAHRLLHRVLQHLRPDQVLRAHEFLLAHYHEQSVAGDFTAHLEEIFHRNQLDQQASIAEWVAAIDGCLAIGRFDRCRALIALLGDLQIDRELDRQQCQLRVARAELGLGRLSEAERILVGLPADSPHSSMLQADLAFVRGDLVAAESLASASVDSVAQPLRLPFMFRLAEIQLYRGRFPQALRHCQEGLQLATRHGDVNQICRWSRLLGEVEFFSGDVAAAAKRFSDARHDLEALPEAARDQMLLADLDQDVALVTGTQGQPERAAAAQRAALEIRKQIGDARGIANSLFGLGSAHAEMGEYEEADRLLQEAERLARDLGEGILLAKTWMVQAEAQVAAGRLDEAEQLLEQALEGFERHGSERDVTSALLKRARLFARRGSYQAWMAVLDRARQLIERGGYQIQYQQFPESAIPPPGRILSGMMAFAAGDALGVPWEGRPAREIDASRLEELPPREDWPRGATSDDTEQLLLVAEYLCEFGDAFDDSEFLRRLASAVPTMHGVGPSTTEAVRRFLETGATRATGGASNGAVMRILPVGWAVPVVAADRRRDLAVRVAQVTHGAETAIASACAVAAMASWAVEGCPVAGIIQAGLAELDWFEKTRRQDGDAFGRIRAAATRAWMPNPEGVTLDAVETVAAVVHVLRTSVGLAAALRDSVLLGGDTDTVAAIVGGILGCRSDDGASGLPWLAGVRLPERESLQAITAGLHRVRRSFYG
jgi:ADP-ribosylglycohydrolase/tetratricopeptide (TPR) repeat protein